jgi:hypothetical protein
MSMTQNRIALFALLLTGCQAAHAEESLSSASTLEGYEHSVVDQLQKMRDVEEIRQLKARYFRCMDQKDWACFGQTLHENVDFNVAGALYACKDPLPVGTYEDVGCNEAWPSGEQTYTAQEIAYFHAAFQASSAAAVVGFEMFFLGGGQTMHQGHMPEITITSPTTARGIWTLTHHLVFRPELQPDADPPNTVPWFPMNGREQHELFGYGYYTDEYEKVAGVGWRIKRSRFTSFKVDIR